MDINYSYRDVPTLRAFAQSNAFIRGVVGPVGGGKSSACVVEVPRRGLAQRPGRDGIKRTRFAVVRGTYPELRDTTIRTFFQWLPPEYFGRWHAGEHKYLIKAFPGSEIEVLFRALDRPEDVKKLLSMDLTGAWVNEAREIPWAIMDALQGRIGRYPSAADGGPSWFGLWADTNPPDSDSRWFRFFEEGDWLEGFKALVREGVLPHGSQPEDFAAIFKQPSGLSPEAENIPNLPHGYYARLCIGKSKEWVKVYVKGDYGFVSDDRAVFPEYIDDVHCRSDVEPVEGITIYRGWDFGLTPICIFIQVLPDGRVLIFDEMVSDNMGIDRFSDEVLEHCSRSFRGQVSFDDYGDPAGQTRAQTDEKTCFEIMQAKGIAIEPGLQTLRIRLESVRKPLMQLRGGKPQLVLHKRCRTVRKAFMGGYHYRRLMTRAERYTSEPEKNHPYSDVMDGVEYVFTILFGGGLTDNQNTADDDEFARRAAGDRMGPGRGRSLVTGY